MIRFVVVSGLPASGKSTVGAALAAALDLPLFDKDAILEALYESLGVGDAEWRNQLSRSADLVLQRLATQSNGAVLVSWWKHPLSPLDSGTSTAWLRELPGELIELHCRCSARVAVERFFARNRHAGHLDGERSQMHELSKFEQFEALGALGLGRVIEVDTERPVELDALLCKLAVHAANPSEENEMPSVLQRLATWYASNCDGEWEHSFGVKIDTLDNPGWSVEVNLEGTSLDGRPFVVVEDRYNHETEWLRCWAEGTTFHAACGPHRLEDALAIFLEWADAG